MMRNHRYRGWEEGENIRGLSENWRDVLLEYFWFE